MRNAIASPLIPKSGESLAVKAAILAGLFLVGVQNFLLFHGMVEIFSVVISTSIFLVTWNSRRMVRNGYLLFLGVAFLFMGFIDTIHTLAFQGMNVFPGVGANPATQLWVGARFLQSAAFFLAPFFMGRKIREEYFLVGSLIYTVLLFLSIFTFPVFPASYVEGAGLTPFKVVSEYVIILILIASIFMHVRRKRDFDRDVYRLIIASIMVAMLSELCFTRYVGVYDLMNMTGHLFKVISFYLLYKAIVHTALAKPYQLLFRELKESERLLMEERDRARSYFDIAGVILVVIGADQRVRGINRKGASVLERHIDEIIGKNWFDSFIPVSVREEIRDFFLRALRGNGYSDAVPEVYEYPVLSRNGEERLIAWNNVMVQDERGNISGTLNSGEDITERRLAEEALRYRELFESVEDAVFIVDRKERFVEANDQVSRMTGYSREELFDLGVRGIIPPGQIPLVENVERELLRKQKVHFEFNFQTREGEIIPFFFSCKEVPYRGESAFLCVARDITDLKRLQEQVIRSERLAATGEMAASIVHEIKNPLAIIGGFARSIMKRPEDSARAAHNAGIIAAEIERLESLVAEMLDFSRPQVPRRGRVDIVAFIGDILALLGKDIASRGIIVETEFTPERIEYSLDPGQFKQVLINIIQNAVNSMQGSGRLLIRVTLTGFGLGIDIIDTGKGIPAELLERVFEPFFTTGGKGTGLGLAISQRIVQGHGGAITLASEEGTGTTVHIQVPK